MRPRSSSPRLVRRVLVAVLAGGMLVGVGPGAGAAPSSDEVRADLRNAQQRLDEIDEEVSLAVEEYNLARVALDDVEARLAATREELAGVLDRHEALEVTVEEHVRRIYKLGPALELSTVMLAGDPNEAGVRSWTMRRILTEQRTDLESLAASRSVVEATQQRVEVEQREARTNARAHEQARAEVERVFADTQAEVRALNVLLEDTIAEERRRAEEARRRAEAERAARQAAAEEAERRERAAARGTNGSASRPAADPAPSPSPAPTPAPSTRQSADVAVQTALAQLGKPYQWGGSGPNSFDCSGLTSFAWRAAGVTIPRTSRTQFSGTKRITREQLQPGDLVFYHSPISHVAMYIGNGQVVEAPNSGNQVRIRSDGLTRSGIVGYGRV